MLKRRGPRIRRKQTHHHNVYVILLDDKVAKHPSILTLNPKRDSSKPCVYVGMTGIPVEHRFENHKNGYKSAWVVKKYGLRLMPESSSFLSVSLTRIRLQLAIYFLPSRGNKAEIGCT
jgi:hypothetical protein